MGKRFLDTEIWRKAWFRLLPPNEKAAFYFILSECDAVGVWDADLEAATFYLGPIDWEGFLERTNGNFEILENGKWFVVDFCDFQYGTISASSTSKPILSYIALLKKHGLWERVSKGYPKGMHTLQEKEKEKVKEQEKDKRPNVVDFEKFKDNPALLSAMKEIAGRVAEGGTE